MGAASEGVAQQSSAEGADKIATTILQQVLSQSIEACDRCAIRQYRSRIDFKSVSIFGAEPTDGVEAFQCEAEGVDPLVASSTGGIGAVEFDELSFGDICGGGFRQHRDSFRRFRQTVSQQEFRDPVTAEDGAGAGGS